LRGKSKLKNLLAVNGLNKKAQHWQNSSCFVCLKSKEGQEE
jgi:hypothetical protein